MRSIQEFLYLRHGETVGLSDDGDDVDLVAELSHEVNIQGLQTVSVRRDEVKTAVNSVVDDVLSVQAALIF